MNKQDEDKILEIVQLCNNNYEKCKNCRQLECDNRGKYVGAIEMAAWKEQQIIEKAVEYLEPIFKNLAGYNCGGDLTEDFKKYMEKN